MHLKIIAKTKGRFIHAWFFMGTTEAAGSLNGKLVFTPGEWDVFRIGVTSAAFPSGTTVCIEHPPTGQGEP